MSSLNALAIRQRLGRTAWTTPIPFGPDGWRYTARNGDGHIILTVADHQGHDWIHASMSRNGRVPDYNDLKHLHAAVFEDRWAYHLFAPTKDHVNIHEHTLHLFGRLDGTPALPDFTDGTGSI